MSIGIGIGWGSANKGISIGSLITAFKARVYADTGLYSAEACQIAILTKLKSIK